MMCPLQMLSLKDPVVDEMGFVYEKEAILQWLANQPGAGRYPVRAPIAGEAFPDSSAHPQCSSTSM